MTIPKLLAVLRHVRRVADAEVARDLTDAALLDRFVGRRDEAAFMLLVERYGPLVMGVCKRQLDEVHDAEDAFQATFLVLVRKAASIRKRTALGSWLHGVAARVASKARAQTRLRATKERRAAEMPRDDGLDEVTWHELRSVLDEEIARLGPEGKPAVPGLIHVLEDRPADGGLMEHRARVAVRAAALALKKIDPEAAQQAGID